MKEVWRSLEWMTNGGGGRKINQVNRKGSTTPTDDQPWTNFGRVNQDPVVYGGVTINKKT